LMDSDLARVNGKSGR